MRHAERPLLIASALRILHAVAKLVLDPDKSHVRVHTFAEGLLARVAHDLELECRGLSGSAERLSDERATATVEAPVGRIEVGGTIKGGRIDPHGLSPSDRDDVLQKMRREVFHVSEGRVRIEATLEGPKARVRVVPPKGPAVESSVPVRVEATDGIQRVSGTLELSLHAIGSDKVKGPMNAFRVKDKIEVLFDVVFKPEAAG
jgi:hypothetical protein